MRTWDYKQAVTYWGPPTADNGWGVTTFPTPIALECRWENRAEKFISTSGEEIVSRAVVWVKVDLVIGGYLYLGTSVEASPMELSGAFPIRQLYSIPDLRNMFTERRVFL